MALSGVAVAAVVVTFGAPSRAQAEPASLREAVRACLRARGEEAVAACRRALARKPGADTAVTLHRVLALELAALDRWAEAADVYRAWALLRPDDAEVRLRLASALLFGLDRPSEAAAVFQEAAVLAPGGAEAQAGLATALNVLGRHPESVDAFERALALEPGYFEQHRAAGAVYDAAREGRRWGQPVREPR